MSFKGYRDESRANWGQEGDTPLTLDQIKVGALLRIADATEKMAQQHTRLIADRDRFELLWKAAVKRAAELERSNTALKGHVTRLRNKLATDVTGGEEARTA